MAPVDLYIDFETCASKAADLKKVGVDNYVVDPNFAILCMAWKINDGPVELWVPEYKRENGVAVPNGPFVEEINKAVKGGAVVHAHNARFERVIWERYMVPTWEAEPIRLKNWRCTAAKAAVHALPRALDKAAEALKLTPKDQEGRRVMLQLSKERAPTKYNYKLFWEPDDDPEKFEQLYKYCKQDVLVEYELDKAVPDLTPKEQLVWLLDQLINDRGVKMDLDSVGHAITANVRWEKTLQLKLKQITGGKVTSAKQVAAMKKWLDSQGLHLDDLQAATVERTLKEDANDKQPLPDDVRAVLDIRRELGLSSVSKYKAIKDRTSRDGRCRGTLLYYGAERTGRWSGKGFQPQNLPSRDLAIEKDEVDLGIKVLGHADPDMFQWFWPQHRVSKCLSALIRPMLVADKGKKLIVSDFAGIEARVAAWVCRQADLIEAFRTGRDVYQDMAAAIYGGVPEDHGKGSLTRFVGKTAILGLGYQMGWSRFRETLAAAGVDVDKRFAERIVNTYRNKYPQITNGWRRLRECAVGSVEKDKRFCWNKGMSYEVSGDWLYCVLPSKRKLAYYKPEVKEGDTPYGKAMQLTYMQQNTFKGNKWERSNPTFGGKLLENLVQAISRDFLVDAMIRLEKASWPVILTVHDEVVMEVDEDVSVEEVQRIMTEEPKWGQGCPIDAETFECMRYQK